MNMEEAYKEWLRLVRVKEERAHPNVWMAFSAGYRAATFQDSTPQTPAIKQIEVRVGEVYDDSY